MPENDLPTNHASHARGRPAPEGRATTDSEAAHMFPMLPEPYQDPRPRDVVDDPTFAATVGLIEAILTQLDHDLPGPVGVALTFTMIELEDYSTLTPAHPVRFDVRGRDLHGLLEELAGQVVELVSGSTELATTLRYQRVQEAVRDTRELLGAHDQREDAAGGPSRG